MALAIGVHPRDKIYVQSTPIEVVEVHGYTFALLKVNGKVVKVDDQKSVEVLPNVYISCGKPSSSRIDKHAELVARAHEEWDRRASALANGQLSREEYDNLPKVEMPGELLPRLLIEAPREITVLREELYLRNHVRK